MIFRYDDDSLFDGSWEDAPGWGVQTVVFDDPIHGPTLRHQGDFYRQDDNGEVIAIDLFTLLRYVVDELKLVKVGTMVGRKRFNKIRQEAKQDLVKMRARTG